ncbi:MAG: P1 family peptidase [Fimbriimonadaceae bacterium]|nr:P1 family peptidase [Alphaproteobacteria bacterium]
MTRTGPKNLITDIPGINIGNAHDELRRTGVTVLLVEDRCVASCDVRGGGPGTIETDALSPENLVDHIDAIVLSGGSAFGLSAATGVRAWLAEHNRGFPVGDLKIPIVPGAILFDLLNGGDKDWGRTPPYPDLAFRACDRASADFALGSVGAGMGASTHNLKGGLGSASEFTVSGFLVGALAAVNAVGTVTIGSGPHFHAAPSEIGNEFGALGLPEIWPEDARAFAHKARMKENTTLAVVATDAALTAAQAKRLAIAAHDGLARAIYPVHTPFDGDIVFALGTGQRPLNDPAQDIAELGASAAHCLARAIARGVFEATSFDDDGLPSWRQCFGPR